MRKQSLKEKDLDSFCIKHIKEALDKGTSMCKPNRNFTEIAVKIEDLVEQKYKNVLATYVSPINGIVISKIIVESKADRVKEPARKSNAPANAIFTQLRRPSAQLAPTKAAKRESW